MEIAFLVVLNFCVHVTGPPRCGHIEDERGPYQTQLECKERIHQMFNYMNANLPPGSVVAHGVCVKVEGEKLRNNVIQTGGLSGATMWCRISAIN